jgi:glyoxylase-like metal-dependent hydrolase (beta-lactamase superfamily II)
VTTSTTVREVAPGIHEVFLPLPMRPSIVNVWLIDGGDEWALVDTGMRTDESLAALESAMKAVGIEPTAVGKIISTHHHPDHFGTSAPLRERCQASVFLHPLEVDRIQTHLPQPRSPEAEVFFRRHGIPIERFVHVPTPGEFWAGLYAPATPDHLINDDDEIAVGRQRLRVIWTPGHAPGHCCFYLPSTKALIVGDHLLPKISPHVGVYPSGPPNPLADYLRSLDKVAALDVDLVLPAHGATYTDHRHRVRQLKHHHEYRLLAAIDALRARPRTAYDVAQEIFDFTIEAPVQIQFPATFETLAHLALLVEDGRIARTDEGEAILYHPR